MIEDKDCCGECKDGKTCEAELTQTQIDKIKTERLKTVIDNKIVKK